MSQLAAETVRCGCRRTPILSSSVFSSGVTRRATSAGPSDHELREALAGEVAVEIKTLAGREHAYERPSYTTLAEVYVPIVSKTTGQVIGVVRCTRTPSGCSRRFSARAS